MNITKVIFFFLISLGIMSFSLAQDMDTRLQKNKKFLYKVSFNGIPSGYIEWEYLGKEVILDNKEAYVLQVSSDTKILKLLNLASKEQVFLDSQTHLPLWVKRDIVFFGKKELIEEIYNQTKGYVTIKKSNSKTEEDILYQKKPIHNILELLYFFPLGVELKSNKWMSFNLPNQKVQIKLIGERKVVSGENTLSAYFLIGRGAKRFSLWLDKDNRLPLRMEIILPVGKVIILRTENN
ncbi:MAG: hypothetical protein KBB01_01355 [Candidatus Omnitrophica bacterium]|jgi:hypothetical protein|nr:hypothetical protein [Candidatus Omnitrophota bacterium]